MRSEYTDELEAFNEAYARETYLYFAGQKRTPELEPIYDRYGYLFGADEIESLRLDAETAFGERDRKALRYLRTSAVRWHLEAEVRPLSDEIASHDARATVRWAGRHVAFTATSRLLGAEERPEDRHELEARRATVVDETNDLREERLASVHQAAKNLGAESYLALFEELTGVDVGALAGACSGLLAETEARFVTAFESVLAARASVRLADATPADAAFAFRVREFERWFPAARLRTTYRDVMAGLGIRTGAQENVRLDLDDRPGKRDGAFSAAIRVPDEIVLVQRPSGGYGDFRVFMHEAGHAQHAAHTSPDTRVAFVRAGDRAPAEAYAFLFQNLLLDGEFLEETFSVGRESALAGLASIERAYEVRRYAGRLLYERELHGGTLHGSSRERFVVLGREAAHVTEPAPGYLSSVGDGLRVLDYVRGLALEVQMRDHLKTRFGRRWWSIRRAGDLLRDLWWTGNEYSAEEIVSELSLGELSLSPLVEDLLGGLKG